MKQRTSYCRNFAVLLCIAALWVGMYTPYEGVDSFFVFSDSIYTLPNAFPGFQNLDVAENIIGEISEEDTAGFSAGSSVTSSYWIFPLTFSLSTAVLPLIPLLFWVVLKILLQSEFCVRMYTILYIHNSDGGKGDLYRV